MTRNVRARSIGGPGQQQHGGSRSRSQMRGMHFIADATQVDTKRWKARLKPDECKPLAHGVPPAAVTILNHGPAKINVTTGSGISFVHAQTSIAPVDTEVIAVRDYVFVETSTESRLCLISSSFSSPATLASQITVPVPGNKAMPDLEPTVAGQKPAIGPSPAVTEVANSNLTNTIPLAELFSRAKTAIEAGYEFWRRAAEALAAAHEQHGVSQAEMASAIGRSEAWVSMLLRWRRLGYIEQSPFGATTRVGRLQHAEDRAASGVSKLRRSCKPVDLADAKTEMKKTATASDTTRLLIQFKAAVDTLFVKLARPAQEAAFRYLKDKMTPPAVNK